MEVIADELQKNGVHIDIETLSEHIECILGNYRDSYNEAVNALNRFPLNVDMFQKVFKEIKRRQRWSCYGLLDTCLPNESSFQRRDSTSSRPFSCTCFEERWESGRRLYTKPLLVVIYR